MGKIDIATKQYMSHKNIIADAFNFYVYDGVQIIKPEKLQKIDTAEFMMPYGNDAKAAVQKIRDNLMIWESVKICFMILYSMQSRWKKQRVHIVIKTKVPQSN